jgi:hypothetical protein
MDAEEIVERVANIFRFARTLRFVLVSSLPQGREKVRSEICRA